MLKDEFIEKAKTIYKGNFDYSLVPGYFNSSDELSIRCPLHGIFKRKAYLFLSGNHNCRKCQNLKRRLSNSEFIKRANIKHNFKYDYSKTNYKGTNDTIDIICPKHGEFTQLAYVHISGSGCPYCQESKGENIIQKILKEKNIDFQRQKSFTGCGKLRFDFFIPSLNLCIEYDGKQHFEPVSKFGGIDKFQILQKNDRIKNEFCEKNGIKLIRISYKSNTYDKIKTELNNLFFLEKHILRFSLFSKNI